MALSEGEQRRLDEIERALTNDDPKFAATITIDQFRRHRAIVAAALFVVGMVGLVAGLVLADGLLWAGIIISVAGVGAMVGGAVMFFRIRRRG
jgi:Protein of unknown function (DUF3040)